MGFRVDADAYDRFMGRFSGPLAPRFATFAGVAPGLRVLDVGCGPGALTAELVGRVGARSVVAVDPSAPFVAAVRDRLHPVEVHEGSAEHLPFADGSFDAVLAQLVVHFMADPGAGLREMRRVARPGGAVAACVWDHDGGSGPLSLFWESVHELDPQAEGEAGLAGARRGHLTHLMEEAGLRSVEERALSIDVEIPTFEDWWAPFTLGVGPAGDYVASIDAAARAELARRCRARLAREPLRIEARAWAARGLA